MVQPSIDPTPLLTNTTVSESSTSSHEGTMNHFQLSDTYGQLRAPTEPASNASSLTSRMLFTPSKSPRPKSPRPGHSRSVSEGDALEHLRAVRTPIASRGPSPKPPRTPPIRSGGYLEPSRHNHDDHRRYTGTINQCGRHTNEWLFNGFSIRDTVRDGIDKLWHHDHKRE